MRRQYTVGSCLATIFRDSADRFLALARIPQVEFLSRHDSARPAQHQKEKTTQYFPTGIHSQFTAGSNRRFAQDREFPQSFQGHREKYFFASKIDFVETAGCEKILARREEECTGTKIEAEIKRAENMKDQFAPQWNFAIEGETTAATCKATFERVNCAPHMFR